MEINNIDQFKQKIDFISNLGDYKRYTQGLEELGDKTRVISNIGYMKQQMSNLKTTGRLSEDDYQLDILEQYIKDASNYLHIRTPNIQHVYEHYSCCNDFENLINTINGGGKVV